MLGLLVLARFRLCPSDLEERPSARRVIFNRPGRGKGLLDIARFRLCLSDLTERLSAAIVAVKPPESKGQVFPILVLCRRHKVDVECPSAGRVIFHQLGCGKGLG